MSDKLRLASQGKSASQGGYNKDEFASALAQELGININELKRLNRPELNRRAQQLLARKPSPKVIKPITPTPVVVPPTVSEIEALKVEIKNLKSILAKCKSEQEFAQLNNQLNECKSTTQILNNELSQVKEKLLEYASTKAGWKVIESDLRKMGYSIEEAKNLLEDAAVDLLNHIRAGHTFEEAVCRTCPIPKSPAIPIAPPPPKAIPPPPPPPPVTIPRKRPELKKVEKIVKPSEPKPGIEELLAGIRKRPELKKVIKIAKPKPEPEMQKRLAEAILGRRAVIEEEEEEDDDEEFWD